MNIYVKFITIGRMGIVKLQCVVLGFVLNVINAKKINATGRSDDRLLEGVYWRALTYRVLNKLGDISEIYNASQR